MLFRSLGRLKKLILVSKLSVLNSLVHMISLPSSILVLKVYFISLSVDPGRGSRVADRPYSIVTYVDHSHYFGCKNFLRSHYLRIDGHMSHILKDYKILV